MLAPVYPVLGIRASDALYPARGRVSARLFFLLEECLEYGLLFRSPLTGSPRWFRIMKA